MVNDSIIRKAIFAAKKSNVLRAKVGCCLFTDSGNIICYTSNCKVYGTDGKFTIHAEERLLMKICRLNINRFGPLNVLVVRWLKGTNSIGSAKPCSNRCSYLLGKTGFRVYYSDENGEIRKLA